MSNDRILTHINLNTGSTTTSKRSDVDNDDAVECLVAYAEAQSNLAEIPSVAGFDFEGFKLRAQLLEPKEGPLQIPDASIVFVLDEQEEPYVSFALARGKSLAPSLWTIFIQSAMTPVKAVDYPLEPWVARRIDTEDAIPEILAAGLDALERAIAWAWLDYVDRLERGEH
jgi:hypothetical protein